MTQTRWTIVTIALLAGLAAAACGSADPNESRSDEMAWDGRVEPLTLPVSPTSGQPFLSASSRGIVLSWLDHDGPTATLRFAERTADGWSPPRTVASGDDWFVSWADVPSVMRLRDGTLVAHWYTNTDPLIEAYDLWLSYSRDEGQSWSDPFSPHDDGTTTQHGFATLVEMPEGGLGVAWLDGRAMELDATAADGGAMSLRFASYDANWVKTSELEIDERVCECCTTSVAVTAEGPIVAFRDRSLREIRDIHVSRIENGAWTYPRPVAVDNWRIDACPVNGPALSVNGSQVVVAWFTLADNEPRTFAAFSDDAGRTWGDPIRLDDVSSPGHVGVQLLDDGAAIASWVELAEQRSRVRLRRIEASGARSASIEVSGADGRVSGYPRIARDGDELVVVWTESTDDGQQQVKGAAIR